MTHALEFGRANQQIIDLAEAHCAHFRFELAPMGGRGMAEAMSGLPINMRMIHCDHAPAPTTAGSELRSLAIEFYNANCRGCPFRQPRDVPNLATYVAEIEAESARSRGLAAAQAEAAEAAAAERARSRSALAALEPVTAARVLDDLSLVDQPVDSDAGGRSDALARLTELARSAPEVFTEAAVDEVLAVTRAGQSDLFGVLRPLARTGTVASRAVLDAALDHLRGQHAGPDAARAVADLATELRPDDVTPDVARSLIFLAGTPKLHGLAGELSRGRVRDPAGLLAAAKLNLPVVLSVVEEMLAIPAPAPPTELILPTGFPTRRSTPATDHERASAAVASRVLFDEFPDIAPVLEQQLLAAVTVPDSEDYGISPVSEITETLAVMLQRRPSLAALIEHRGADPAADDDVRARLFAVVSEAAHNLRAEPSEPSPDDPPGPDPVDDIGDFTSWRARLTAAEVTTAASTLFTAALTKIDGTWGLEVTTDATSTLERLAGDHPAVLGNQIDALFGALLAPPTVAPAGPIVAGQDPWMAALDALAKSTGESSRRRTLRRSLRALASINPTPVADAAFTILDADPPMPPPGEDATDPLLEHDENLRAELIELLGELGRDHPAEPGLLRRVLPEVYSALLGTSVRLRMAGLTAWAELTHSAQPLPTTLADCMPVLLGDATVGVVSALLHTFSRLPLRDEDIGVALRWAVAVCRSAPGEHNLDLDSAINALFRISARARGHERLYGFAVALDACKNLHPYKLIWQLDRDWPDVLRRSRRYAELCLQAFDRDRHGDRRDDRKLLIALQRCTGTAQVSLDAFRAVVDNHPWPGKAAELVEVLTHHGRFADAATLAEAHEQSLPATTEFASRRVAAAAIRAATALEVAVATDPEAIAAAADAVRDVVVAVRNRDKMNHSYGAVDRLADLADARVELLAAIDTAGPGLSPDELDAVAAALTDATGKLRRTVDDSPSGHVIATLADVVDIAVLTVRADAALQRGVTGGDSHDALKAAACRRAEVAVERLDQRTPGGGSIDALRGLLGELAMGTPPMSAVLAAIRAIAVPVRAVDGPVTSPPPPFVSSRLPERSIPKTDDGVLVVLASIDDQPCVNHAQVLHPDQAYELRLDVRASSWPEWAERLDIEMLTVLRESDLTLPSFSFPRPTPSTTGGYAASGSGTLVLRFRLAPGRPPQTVRIAARFAGPPEVAGERERVAVAKIAGHPELALRPFDPTRDMLTDYPSVDARLLDLYARLHGRELPDDDIQATARLFTAIVTAAERIQFDATYKRGTRVTERQFHDDLEARLRADSRLGGRLTRNDPRALGYLDLDHDGVTAELKVERKTPVTADNCHRYLGQPTQYATGGGKRLSILCVLDLSAKAAPPGALENHVWLMQPAAHGLTDPAHPSLVLVVVINANLPTPSSWSRRTVDAERVDGESS
jgi:hypothetical protein